MQTYTCRCGETVFRSAMAPAPCESCPTCGTRPNVIQANAVPPAEHSYRIETARGTDTKILRCKWCGRKHQDGE